MLLTGTRVIQLLVTLPTTALLLLSAPSGLTQKQAPAGARAHKAKPPSTSILFQPKFVWANSDVSLQGTGFIIEGFNGQALAVTSSHYLNFKGPALIKVEWLGVNSSGVVVTMTSSWGRPGNAATTEPLDLRSDYLIMPTEGDVPEESVLELDERTSVRLGERVWLPNKDGSPVGYTLIEGVVEEAEKGYLYVILRQPTALISQSGSPLISQLSGKVIGLVSRGGALMTGETAIILTPVTEIRRVAMRKQRLLPLRSVVGR